MRFRQKPAAAAPQPGSTPAGLLASFKGWEKTPKGTMKAVFLTATGKEGRYTLEQLKKYSGDRGFEFADKKLFGQALQAYQRRKDRADRQEFAYLSDRFDF